MATKQISSDTVLFVETTVDETHKNSNYPPTTKAVFDALGGVEGDIPEVESEVTEDSTKVPTSGAVYTAIEGAKALIPAEADIKAYVYDTIYMSANDKTYAVTIDAQGALAVAEVEEEVEEVVDEGGGE